MQSDPHAIWVLTDGTAGNEAQALGLAEALARQIPVQVEVHRITPKPGAARLPARLWHRMGARAGGWPFTGYEAAVAPPWPALAIGAGRRIAPLIAALRSVHRVRSVQILDSGIPTEAFDLVVAPAHDGLAGPNVLETLGSLGRVTPRRIAAEAEAWRRRLAHLPQRRVACLIGGPSKSVRWRRDDRERLVRQLAALSHSGRGLLITGSRRSEPGLIAAIEEACDPAATFIWNGTGENPYPAILGLAEAVLVTADSVNMASEAAASGAPVHVLQLSGLPAKFRDFHRALAERSIARDFTGEIGAWNYAPLAEADRIAGLIAPRLFPPDSPPDLLAGAARGAI